MSNFHIEVYELFDPDSWVYSISREYSRQNVEIEEAYEEGFASSTEALMAALEKRRELASRS